MLKLPIYLDSHATTPVDPRVLEAMLPYFTERFGNPSSATHAFGWQAAEAVERARRQVADLINASPRDIVFTGCGTEANNLAIKGVAGLSRDRGDHIVTVTTEHKSVLDACRRLERRGVRVSYLPVRSDGRVDPAVVERELTDRTILLTVMLANNEIGVIQPIADVASMAGARGIPVHTDAIQAAGKVPVDVEALQVDFLSISAHKMYGPKGVGALYVRRRGAAERLEPLLDGGGHERGLRSGTLNVPGIVGLGQAAEVCRLELPSERERIRELRDRLAEGLFRNLPGVSVNGSRERRLPHNLHVSFDGVDGESLMLALGDLAVSSGSACSSARQEPSHVLRALRLADDLAFSSVRFGLSRFTTDEEIDYAIEKVTAIVRSLREGSPRLGDAWEAADINWPSVPGER
jgi:cysteine desulfurase